MSLRTYDSTSVPVEAKISLRIKSSTTEVSGTVLVQKGAPQSVLLGTDLMESLGFYIARCEEILPRPDSTQADVCEKEQKIPVVRLLRATKLPTRHAQLVEVELEGAEAAQDPMLVEVELPKEAGSDHEMQVEAAVIELNGKGRAKMWLENSNLHPIQLEEGQALGKVTPVEVVTLEDEPSGVSIETNNILSLSVGQNTERMRKLCTALRLSETPVKLEERDALAMLIARYQDVFALEGGELGVTHLTEHRIETEGAEPIKQYARRIPHLLRAKVNELVNDMLQREVITPSNSPWSSPIVLVRKKDGTYRFCVDYRRLNAVTKTEVYPLPRIDDYLDALSGAKYFTTLDLASGFWQVAMEEGSADKTTFVTHEGAYKFKVMPFGLKNAPA